MHCQHLRPTGYYWDGHSVDWCPDCGAIRSATFSDWELPAEAINRGSLLLDRLLEAVQYVYPDDPCAPGIVCSKLPRGGKFYASIVRYLKEGGQEKMVVHQATEISIENALQQVAHQLVYLNAVGRNPLERLKELLAPKASLIDTEKTR